MAKLAVAGLVCVDVLPELSGPPVITPGALTEVGALTLCAGGCVGNTGTDIVSMGMPVGLHADIGDDDLGRLLVAILAEQGCDVTGFHQVAGERTSYSIVIQPPDRDRSFWHYVGANAQFDGSRIDLAGVELLHVGYPTILPRLAADGGRRMQDLFNRARNTGVTTSLDLSTLDPTGRLATHDWRTWLRAVLPLTDVLTPSLDDLRGTLVDFDELVPDPMAAAVELVDLGAAAALVTAGADGLYVVTADRSRLDAAGQALAPMADGWSDLRLHIAAADVPVLTTNGAGDAAAAGFLFGIMSGHLPQEAIRLAAAAAAYRVSRPGPLPQFRDLDDFCRPVNVRAARDLNSQRALGVA